MKSSMVGYKITRQRHGRMENYNSNSEGSSTPSPYRDWLRVLAHKATNDRNKLLTMLLNRLKYILFNNTKGLFCVTQVECSSNNVIRLLRNFPTSLGVVSVMQLRMLFIIMVKLLLDLFMLPNLLKFIRAFTSSICVQ